MTQPRQIPLPELLAQLPMEFLPLVDFIGHARSFATAVPEPGGTSRVALDLQEAAEVYVRRHPTQAAILIGSLAAQHLAMHHAHPGYRFVRSVKIERRLDPALAPSEPGAVPSGVPDTMVAEEAVTAPLRSPSPAAAPAAAPVPYWARNLRRSGGELCRLVGAVLAGFGAYYLLDSIFRAALGGAA